MKKTNLLFLILLTAILIVPTVNAEPESVISNSNNWEDVYSTLVYSELRGANSHFLVSTAHSTLLLYGISKGTEIEVVSSSKNRFIVGYDEIIINQGYPEESVEKVYDNINLRLAEDLEDINKFIVSYSYIAINHSCCPFS